jgi:hypothetical protein
LTKKDFLAILYAGGSQIRDIEVRNPEKASDDTHYHGFFIRGNYKTDSSINLF